MTRYHKAAIDGYLDLLKEATRKDLNTPDEDGMTPTLLAAFHGHIDALQLICSREGDPNKSDIWGNTPLHHAAANGHMHILSFLVNFGANIFALDNEFHTAMDVAASQDRMDCLPRSSTNQNAKKVAMQKKEAVKEAEKRVKLCEKVTKKHQSRMDKLQRGGSKIGPDTEANGAATFSNGGTVTSTNEQFSKLIAAEKTGSLSSRVKDTLQRKLGKKGRGTVQSSGGDGNVIFLKQEGGASEKPEFLDVFHEQDEILENDVTEDFEEDLDEEELGQSKQSIFNRPGLGGLIFMKKMGMESEDMPRANMENLGYLVQNELCVEEEDAVGFEETGDTDLPWHQEDLGLDDDEDDDSSPLDVFLSAISLQEFAVAFSKEHLDMEALMLCTDEDLKGIRIQLGPRKKILEAVARRSHTLKTPGIIKDSSL
ncbi:unnamed protein product, partial [Tetraodon nigroviridis]